MKSLAQKCFLLTKTEKLFFIEIKTEYNFLKPNLEQTLLLEMRKININKPYYNDFVHNNI